MHLFVWIHKALLHSTALLKQHRAPDPKVKGKGNPGQALRATGGWGTQISWQSAHECGKVVSPTHRPLLLPRRYRWYSFLLEAESTPGLQCDRKDYVNEKFQWQLNPRPSGLYRSASTNCVTAYPRSEGTVVNYWCLAGVYRLRTDNVTSVVTKTE